MTEYGQVKDDLLVRLLRRKGNLQDAQSYAAMELVSKTCMQHGVVKPEPPVKANIMRRAVIHHMGNIMGTGRTEDIWYWCLVFINCLKMYPLSLGNLTNPERVGNLNALYRYLSCKQIREYRPELSSYLMDIVIDKEFINYDENKTAIHHRIQ